jgi:methylated-DNA-[protein]-cysteine S-methyltransferase
MKSRTIESGLGTFVLFARGDHLSRLELFTGGAEEAVVMVTREVPEAIDTPTILENVVGLLARYVKGEKVEFDVPVDLTALKPFTARVLTEIRKIPYGKTASYGTIARRLGHPNAARAVGQALKRNPIPVVIPCHRVVNGDGSLGGFGMGLNMKTRLLSIEGVHVGELHQSMIPSR